MLPSCLLACRTLAYPCGASFLPHRVLERALRIDSSTATFYVQQAGCDIRAAIEKVG